MCSSGLPGSLAGWQIGGWSWCVFCTMWQAKLANSTCLASLDYAWKPSWISAELSPFLFKMVFWYLSKWRHGIIILAVKKLGLKIHFYEKWGYLFLPTNMTISWGHGLWTPKYREFSPYANFISENFISAIFQNFPKTFGLCNFIPSWLMQFWGDLFA